jgi:hypothetical protein
VIIILVSLTSPELAIQYTEVTVFFIIIKRTVDVRYSYVYGTPGFEYSVPFFENGQKLVSSKVFENMRSVNLIDGIIFIGKILNVCMNIGIFMLYVDVHVTFETSVPTP